MSTTSQKPLYIDVTAIMLACDEFDGVDAKVGEIFNIDADYIEKFADILQDEDNQYGSYANMVRAAIECIIEHPPVLAHSIVKLAGFLSGRFFQDLLLDALTQ